MAHKNPGLDPGNEDLRTIDFSLTSSDQRLGTTNSAAAGTTRGTDEVWTLTDLTGVVKKLCAGVTVLETRVDDLQESVRRVAPEWIKHKLASAEEDLAQSFDALMTMNERVTTRETDFAKLAVKVMGLEEEIKGLIAVVGGTGDRQVGEHQSVGMERQPAGMEARPKHDWSFVKRPPVEQQGGGRWNFARTPAPRDHRQEALMGMLRSTPAGDHLRFQSAGVGSGIPPQASTPTLRTDDWEIISQAAGDLDDRIPEKEVPRRSSAGVSDRRGGGVEQDKDHSDHGDRPSRATKKKLRAKDSRSRSTAGQALSTSRCSRKFSTTDDSDTDSDSDEQSRHVKRASSVMPKIQTFTGKSSEWRSFIFNFRQIARQLKWSETKKRQNLLACLRSKAVEFIQNKPRHILSDYKQLRDALAQRYDLQEHPPTARRQFMALKQEEGEALEEFADRILNKASEAFQHMDDGSVQTLASEAFLKGCKDRCAAYEASKKDYITLFDALQAMRDAVANLKTFGRSPSIATARQVMVRDQDAEKVKEREEHSKLVTQFTCSASDTPRGEAMAQQPRYRERAQTPTRMRSRSRSPSPNARCFNCGKSGHWRDECTGKLTCFQCNKEGHMARDCRDTEVKGNSKQEGSN